MTRARSFKSFSFVVAILSLGLVIAPLPAAAQFGGLERAFKKAIKVPKLIDPGTGKRSGNSGSSGSGEESTDTPTSNKEVKAEIDRLEQARLRRDIVLNQKERDEENRSRYLERQRNVEQAVEDFLSCLKQLHGITKGVGGELCVVDADDKAGKSLLISQVTAGEVTREVEDAYKQARLYDFERLAGELWTRERLLVRIVDRSAMELPPYFKGVGAKGPSMDDLKKIFASVAREVYSRSLEVSEVAGVSQSFDRFIRTIYEKSGKSNFHLWTDGADGKYERFVTAALGAVPRQKFIKEGATQAVDPLGIERQFKFRFRARRVIYDCLSTNYGTFVGSASQAAQLDVSRPAGATSAGGTGASGSAMNANIVETGSTEGGLQNVVWQKAQEFVQTSCREGVEGVSKLVVADRVKPESARWISAKAVSSSGSGGSEQGQVQGAQVAPLKNEGSEQPPAEGVEQSPQ